MNLHKKITIFIPVLLALFFLSFDRSFAGDDDKKTIKELKAHIKELRVDKKELNHSYKKFIAENGELEEYFKKDISPADLKGIALFIDKYNADILQINADTTGNVIQKTLERKKKLYISFIQYISVPKLELYKKVIIRNIKDSTKGKIIDADIAKKEKILDIKSTLIKEKIAQNQRRIKGKLYELIKSKMTHKLRQYLKNPKIKGLTRQKQQFIFRRVLGKIKERIGKLQYDTGEGAHAKKTEMYIIMKEVLEDFINSLGIKK